MIKLRLSRSFSFIFLDLFEKKIFREKPNRVTSLEIVCVIRYSHEEGGERTTTHTQQKIYVRKDDGFPRCRLYGGSCSRIISSVMMQERERERRRRGAS